jgi:hypothetical protein
MYRQPVTLSANLSEKQMRNLRVTLAVIIAKLKLNTAMPEEGKPYFVNREGLLQYIQTLISHAMLGADRLEIPEFYYSRDNLNDYNQLKQLLVSALTELQRGSGDANLPDVHNALLMGLRHIG